MITAALLSELNGLTVDNSTVAIGIFMALLVIYFFLRLKPAIDSKRRVERLANRRFERYQANNLYQTKVVSTKPPASSNNRAKITAQSSVKPSDTKSKTINKRRSNNGYYKKDKGYQEYLRRNSNMLRNKQVVKHVRFARASKATQNLKMIKLAPFQSFDKKADSFVPFSQLSSNEKSAWVDQVRKSNGL